MWCSWVSLAVQSHMAGGRHARFESSPPHERSILQRWLCFHRTRLERAHHTGVARAGLNPLTDRCTAEQLQSLAAAHERHRAYAARFCKRGRGHLTSEAVWLSLGLRASKQHKRFGFKRVLFGVKWQTAWQPRGWNGFQGLKRRACSSRSELERFATNPAPASRP